jgi:hypothetical protein
VNLTTSFPLNNPPNPTESVLIKQLPIHHFNDLKMTHDIVQALDLAHNFRLHILHIVIHLIQNTRNKGTDDTDGQECGVSAVVDGNGSNWDTTLHEKWCEC